MSGGRAEQVPLATSAGQCGPFSPDLRAISVTACLHGRARHADRDDLRMAGGCHAFGRKRLIRSTGCLVANLNTDARIGFHFCNDPIVTND